jgi:hypothetical protein
MATRIQANAVNRLKGAAQGARPELPKPGSLEHEQKRKSTIAVLVA